MNEPYVYETKQLYLQLDNALQLRLNRVKEIKEFSSQKSMADKR